MATKTQPRSQRHQSKLKNKQKIEEEERDVKYGAQHTVTVTNQLQVKRLHFTLQLRQWH